MKNYNDLSVEELREVARLGNEFREKHKLHVDNLIKIAKVAIAPSGSDLFHPELWKPIHWKWFVSPAPAIEEMNDIKQEILDIVSQVDYDDAYWIADMARIREILSTHALEPIDEREFDPTLCGFVKIPNTMEDWTNGQHKISYRKGVGLIERLEESFIFSFPWPTTQSDGKRLLELLGVLK